jgi:cytochrome c553
MQNFKLPQSIKFLTLSALLTMLSACATLDSNSTEKLAVGPERTANLSCGGCHGPNHVPVSFKSPNIIGQKKEYLSLRIRNFRDTPRSHPYVNGLLAKMTDQEIANLAAYYANYKQSKY